MTTYTVKNVKSFRGIEGHGYNADLLRDGKKVAFLIDEGSGGQVIFHWVDDKVGGARNITFKGYNYKDELVEMRGTREEANLHEYLNTLPPTKVDFGDGDKEMRVSPDMFVASLIDDVENEKRLKRLLKTKTVVLEGEQLYTYKGLPTDQLRAKIAAKGGKILNDMPFAEALKLFVVE